MSDKKELCGELAAWSYVWPGKDRAYACPGHAIGIQNIANAIGMYLQLEPALGPDCESVGKLPQQKAVSDER